MRVVCLFSLNPLSPVPQRCASLALRLKRGACPTHGHELQFLTPMPHWCCSSESSNEILHGLIPDVVGVNFCA